jgi:hypothetical protein
MPHPRSSKALRILPGWIFVRLEASLPGAVAVWLAVAVLGGVLSHVGGQALVLVQFGVSVFPDWVDEALFPVSMLAYLAFCLVASYLLSRRETNSAGLFASGVAYVPYLIIPAVAALGSTVAGSIGVLYLLLAILVQGLGVILGATYMSTTYGMRLERSLLLQLLFYVAATAAYSFLQYAGLMTDIWRSLSQLI